MSDGLESEVVRINGAKVKCVRGFSTILPFMGRDLVVTASSAEDLRAAAQSLTGRFDRSMIDESLVFRNAAIKSTLKKGVRS